MEKCPKRKRNTITESAQEKRNKLMESIQEGKEIRMENVQEEKEIRCRYMKKENSDQTKEKLEIDENVRELRHIGQITQIRST